MFEIVREKSVKVYVHMYNGNVQQNSLFSVHLGAVAYNLYNSVAHKRWCVRGTQFTVYNNTSAYLPGACTQYAVYAFNYGDLCTPCTTFDKSVYTVYNIR